jgi:predicted TIM-barrel fold metal-dependent hydrolase
VSPDTPLAELRGLRDRGIVGLRFQWRYLARQPDLCGADYRALLGHARDLGWHIQLHDNAWRLASAIAAIQSAGLPLVIDHFGRPDPALGTRTPGFVDVLRAVARGGTWVKLSAAFRVGTVETARELTAALLAEAGPEWLLWGSDWPFAGFEGKLSYADTLRTFATLVPSANDRRAIHRAAGRLYFPDTG